MRTPTLLGGRIGCLQTWDVSVLEQPGQPRFLVLEPEEGLRQAMALPAEEDLVIEDVTDEEWKAFHEAIAER